MVRSFWQRNPCKREPSTVHPKELIRWFSPVDQNIRFQRWRKRHWWDKISWTECLFPSNEKPGVDNETQRDSPQSQSQMKMMKRPQNNTLVQTIHITLSDVSFKVARQKSPRLPRRCISPRIRRTLVKATRTWQSQCSVCVKIRPKSFTSGDYLIILFSIVLWRGKVIICGERWYWQMFMSLKPSFHYLYTTSLHHWGYLE